MDGSPTTHPSGARGSPAVKCVDRPLEALQDSDEEHATATQAALLSLNLEDLVEIIITSTSALAAREQGSPPASSEERYIIGCCITRITADLATLSLVMRNQVTGHEDYASRGETAAQADQFGRNYERIETLRVELRKANSAARAYEFAAGHY